MRFITKKNLILFSSISIIALIFLSNQKFKYPSQNEINQRIEYLDYVISKPLNDESEIIELGKVNYEWMLFTYSYTTYAISNLVERDPSSLESLIPLMKKAINRVLEEPVFLPYDIEIDLLLNDSIPDYSVLYLGHLNLMLGKYRQISSDSSFNKLNDNISKSLYERYTKSQFLNLESYPNSIWIPDNSVAIASLHLHSTITDSNYKETVRSWLYIMKNKYIEPETGVLYSMINPQNGEPYEEARGSMLGWSIMFISQFDREFAKDLYYKFEDSFSTNLGILQPFKERYNVSRSDMGDIDSGPILFGYSIPANEFALANAIFANDLKTAKRIQRLIELGTSRNYSTNGLSYNTRFVDFQISPMAEALVLFSLSIQSF